MRRELIAGALLALVARGPWVNHTWRHSLLGRAVIELAPSVFYERVVDVNGWSWTDVGQRTLGSVGAEITLSLPPIR